MAWTGADVCGAGCAGAQDKSKQNEDSHFPPILIPERKFPNMKPTQLAWAALLVGVIVLALAVALVVVGDQKGWLTSTARIAIALPITAVASAFLGCAAVAAANKLIDEDDSDDDEDAYGNTTTGEGENESAFQRVAKTISNVFGMKSSSVSPSPSESSQDEVNPAPDIVDYATNGRYNVTPGFGIDDLKAPVDIEQMKAQLQNPKFRAEISKFMKSLDSMSAPLIQFLDHYENDPKTSNKEKLRFYKIVRCMVGENSYADYRDDKYEDINIPAHLKQALYTKLSEAIHDLEDRARRGRRQAVTALSEEPTTKPCTLDEITNNKCTVDQLLKMAYDEVIVLMMAEVYPKFAKMVQEKTSKKAWSTNSASKVAPAETTPIQPF
jgi:hypothetical protein